MPKSQTSCVPVTVQSVSSAVRLVLATVRLPAQLRIAIVAPHPDAAHALAQHLIAGARAQQAAQIMAMVSEQTGK